LNSGSDFGAGSFYIPLHFDASKFCCWELNLRDELDAAPTINNASRHHTVPKILQVHRKWNRAGPRKVLPANTEDSSHGTLPAALVARDPVAVAGADLAAGWIALTVTGNAPCRDNGPQAALPR
jgi:hypothetical protein